MSNTPENNVAATPWEDLRTGALQAYDEAATVAHSWSSVIPRAINFYFDNANPTSNTVPDADRSRCCSAPVKSVGAASDEYACTQCHRLLDPHTDIIKVSAAPCPHLHQDYPGTPINKCLDCGKSLPDAPPPGRAIADRMMAEFQAYWDRHDKLKTRASGHPVTEIDRADIAARSEAETPLCPVHRSLDRQGTLELSVGNGCVACALNERKELLEALATALPPEGADSVSFTRELVLSAIHIKESAARSEGEAGPKEKFVRSVDVLETLSRFFGDHKRGADESGGCGNLDLPETNSHP